jgi:hypothetical protein
LSSRGKKIRGERSLYSAVKPTRYHGCKPVEVHSDCQHEVKKIKQGHRVALTYNVVLEAAQIEFQEHVNINLEEALKDYFRLEETIGSDPLKLVYFLDYSYTQHSLRWNMLKGTDSLNALAFRYAAKKLGLIPHLSLVELYKSWTSEGDEDNPEPDELIDDSAVLSYWLDENDQRLTYGDYYVSDQEVCWTKDTEEFAPTESEYEGYIGNYGNTVDYWYRRAAVVLWRESDQIAMNFSLNYDCAIENLLTLTKDPGHEKQVLDIIKKAGNYLSRSQNNSKKNYFKSFAQISLYIQNEEVAKYILADFSLTVIEIDTIEELIKLQNLYSGSWCLKLMKHWREGESKYRVDSNLAQKDINNLVRHLLALEGDVKLVEFLLQYYIDSVIENDKRCAHAKPVELRNSLDKRMSVAKNLIYAAGMMQDDSVIKKLINYLISNTKLYPELDLADVLFELKDGIVGNHILEYSLLLDHVITSIGQELNMGLRDEGDWSIGAKLSCRCDYCKIAEDFLQSKTQSSKTWPIITQYRDHIIDVFKGLGLPIDLSVEKKGSPYKLVMVKNDKLYQDAKIKFDKLKYYDKKLKNSFRTN